MSKGVLITGATGNQGGATIDALLADPSTASDFTILAVTRSPTSPSAQRLVAKAPSTIKLVQGDLNDVPALFKNAKSVHSNIWGVYSVQVMMGQGQSVDTERIQGKAMVDEAIKSGVEQFVYSSVERGGNTKSDTNPTDVPHFISKHEIELHLKDKIKGTNMNYTILRPVAFMENWTPGFMGKAFGAMWKAGLPYDTRVQLVAVADIGYFAAQAFLHPQKYRNRALGLAGDEVTFAEADKVFKNRVGYAAPATFTMLGHGMLLGVKEMGKMFGWFKREGYGVDISTLRAEHPGLLNLGDWIEKKSGYGRK